MKFLLILFLFYPYFVFSLYTKSVYVSNQSVCKYGCGTKYKPFGSIFDAIESIEERYPNAFDFSDSDSDDIDLFNIFKSNENNQKNNSYTIFLFPGTYKGKKNKDLLVSTPINIKSTSGSKKTIIDCENSGKGIEFRNQQIQFNGITIQNCKGNFGGAISLIQTLSILEDIILLNNTGSYGGGLYIQGKSATILSSIFLNNFAIEKGSSIYIESGSLNLIGSGIMCSPSKEDIYCLKSTISMESSTSNSSTLGVNCVTSTVEENGKEICGQKQACYPLSTPKPSNPPIDVDQCQIKYQSRCNIIDGYCDVLTESCLTCPEDCKSCAFDGLKLSIYVGCSYPYLSDDCLYSIGAVPFPEITSFMKDSDFCNITGHMEGYFSIPLSGSYKIYLKGSNIGAKLIINGRPVIDRYFYQPEFISFASIQLDKDSLNKISIIFSSNSILDRNISLQWIPDLKQTSIFTRMNSIFYSQHVCGDGILDREEKCDVDLIKNNTFAPSFCGDGICQEVYPNLCIIDCFDHITKKCPAQAEPARIDSSYPTNEIIGSLLNNQYLYRLPGLEHLQHGIDIVSGDEKPASLFSFGFCQNETYSKVQDLNRGLVYNIPRELFADINPSCSYEISTSSFVSSAHISSTMSQSNSMSVSGEVSAKIPFASITASVAYSKERSVEAARELESMRTGSLFKTDIKCQTSKVQMNSYQFHSGFIKDISKVNTKNEMKSLLEKYGTHFYKTAILGGKLTQLTILDSNFESSVEKSSIRENIAMSFSTSVSSTIGGVAGFYSTTLDNEQSIESQQSFQGKSTRSNIITYGGAPGSYGPSEAEETSISNFGDWSSSVDLLPIPIESTLKSIGEIIPATWLSKEGLSLKSLWNEAEIEYYESLTPIPIKGVNPYVYKTYELKIYYVSGPRTGLYDVYQYDTLITISGKNSNKNESSNILMSNIGSNHIWKWDEHHPNNPAIFSFFSQNFNPVKSIQINLLNNITGEIVYDHKKSIEYIRIQKIELFDGLNIITVNSNQQPIEDNKPFVLCSISLHNYPLSQEYDLYRKSDSLEIVLFTSTLNYVTYFSQQFPTNTKDYPFKLKLYLPGYSKEAGEPYAISFKIVSGEIEDKYKDNKYADSLKDTLKVSDIIVSIPTCTYQSEGKYNPDCPSDHIVRTISKSPSFLYAKRKDFDNSTYINLFKYT